MTQEENIKEIKKRFRLAMNGVVSTIQRRQGLDYKINFGVEINRVKGIADDFEQDASLASALWKENIRESKLMAIFLMPVAEFSPERADEWLADAKFTEIAENVVKHLIAPQPFAAEKATEYIGMEEGLFAYCGYLIFTHLLRTMQPLSQEQEARFLAGAAAVLATCTPGSRVVQRCAYNALSLYIERYDARERVMSAAPSYEEDAPLASLLQEF